MTAFTMAQLEALMRAGSFHSGLDLGRERDQSKTFHYSEPRPTPKPSKPSRYDGADVIDLVRGADGVFCIPAHLEHQARKL